MNLAFPTELEEFRLTIRAELSEMLPVDMAMSQQGFGGLNSLPELTLAWTAILNQRGWAVPHWPEEYGGTGWSPMQLYAFNDELSKAWAPDTCWGATHMCGR